MSSQLFVPPSTDLYAQSKNQLRKDYEKRLKQIKNKDLFKDQFGKMMRNVNRGISFEVDIANKEENRLAFTETLRRVYTKRYGNKKAVVKAYTIDGKYKWFTLSDKHNMESTIGHISGEIDLGEDQSDTNPYVTSFFVPVKYELLFLNHENKSNKATFSVYKENPENKEVFKEEIEIDPEYRATPEASFFPYLNTSKLDLTPYQIFSNVNPKNYKDNCFVYACIQSGLFTDEEITHLRFYVQTRSVPNNKIIEIAKEFKCNFVVRRIDENFDVRHQQQIKIDTRKQKWAKDFNRSIDLLLYKDHYMLYKNIPATVYYLEHEEELIQKFPKLPLKRIMLIRSIQDDEPKFSENGTLPMQIFRKMFDLHLFVEIKACEMNILNTTEYDHLNDYDSLEYHENLCTQLINSAKDKKERKWSRIYYSDFETDTTLSPHVPYLNCTVFRERESIHKLCFYGVKSGKFTEIFRKRFSHILS